MGLAVKTDGAAAASGAMADALISVNVPEAKNWILATAVTTKVFIDIWIGLWAFILALWWVLKVERKPEEKVNPLVIWYRFPKFVIGYFVTTFAILSLALVMPLENAQNTAKNYSRTIRYTEKIFLPDHLHLNRFDHKFQKVQRNKSR